MRLRLGFLVAGLLTGGLLILPSRSLGQGQIEELELSGEAEVGGRVFVTRPARTNRAAYEEYRDIPSGIYLEELRIGLETGDKRYAVEVRAPTSGVRFQR